MKLNNMLTGPPIHTEGLPSPILLLPPRPPRGAAAAPHPPNVETDAPRAVPKGGNIHNITKQKKRKNNK